MAKPVNVLRAGALQRADMADMKYRVFFEELPEGVQLEQIFNPGFWMHHKQLRKWDIVRLARADFAFDIEVTVREVVAGGVVVDFRCGRISEELDAEMAVAEGRAEGDKLAITPLGRDLKPQVYVQYLQKTQWRVIGLNAQEVIRDLPTKAQAETEMAKYLHSIRMRLPTDDELAVMVKEVIDRREAAKV